MPKTEVHTIFQGQKLKLTNLQKLIFPESGIIKAEVIQYYMDVSSLMLPFLRKRPSTLLRFPDGIGGTAFYTKDTPDWAPKWIDTIPIQHEEKEIQYLDINDGASLIWVANLSGLEIHPVQYVKGKMDKPDHIIFDLDPDASVLFSTVKEIAQELRKFLSKLGLPAFIKTSGGKGFHIYIPIKQELSFEEVFKKTKEITGQFVTQFPRITTLSISKDKRKGKILIDIYRNHKSHTNVAPFCLRGREGAPISAPFSWEEIDSIDSPAQFTLRNANAYLDAFASCWDSFFKEAVSFKNASAGLIHAIQLDSTGIEFDIEKKLKDQNELESSFHSPMLAEASTKLPVQRFKYLFEVKWDGIRSILVKKGNRCQVFSRSGRDISASFLKIKSALAELPCESIILDAELVVLNEKGVPVFEDIISRMHAKNGNGSSKKVTAYVFDCLMYNGKNICSLEIEQRKEIMKSVITENQYVKISQVFSDGKALFAAAKGMGLEGVMAKRKKSKYLIGERSRDWLKIKYRQKGIFTIIGYTVGEGDRSELFGSLHLVSITDDGVIYRGRVGSGFDHKKLKMLLEKFESIQQSKKAFKVDAEEERTSTWLKPELQCEVKFASFTQNGTLREPVFIQLIQHSKINIQN